MRTWGLALFFVGFGLACGDDDAGRNDGSDGGPGSSNGGTGTLDCASLSSESSCTWSVHRRVVEDCALPVTEQGVLSDDRSVCTYASGAEVDFDGPLDLSEFGFSSIRFTIRRDGSDCVSWDEVFGEAEQSQVIVVGEETFRRSVDASGRIELQCPGGERLVGDARDLAGCLDDGPTTINIGSSAGIGFEIAFPNEPPDSIFQCILP